MVVSAYFLLTIISQVYAVDLETSLESVVLLQVGSSWCSGVLIDEKGTIATAYHCVSSGRKPKVITKNRQEYKARIIAYKADNDLALIQAEDLLGGPFLKISQNVSKVGDEIWALGHPFAPQASSRLFEGLLQWSVSKGIVSAVGEKMIQVDAALNPGNSGDPIINNNNEVIGIASRRINGDNIAFIASNQQLNDLIAEPKKSVFGGSWGLSLSTLQSLNSITAFNIGAVWEADVRDRFIVKVFYHVPIGHRWLAAETSQANWISGGFTGALRMRFFSGYFATSFDLGGGFFLKENLRLLSVDNDLDFSRDNAELEPMIEARLGLMGVGFKLVRTFDNELLLGLEIDFPGTLGTF